MEEGVVDEMVETDLAVPAELVDPEPRLVGRTDVLAIGERKNWKAANG